MTQKATAAKATANLLANKTNDSIKGPNKILELSKSSPFVNTAVVKRSTGMCPHDLPRISCQNCSPNKPTTQGKSNKIITNASKVIDQKYKANGNIKALENHKGLERFSSLSPSSLNSTTDNSNDVRDIDELLNFIEGNKSVDKAALAEKKAAKKARQRLRKVWFFFNTTFSKYCR